MMSSISDISEVIFLPQTSPNSQNEQEQLEKLTTIKDKIIKTDQLIKLFTKKTEENNKLQATIVQLKSKFNNKAGEIKRYKLENNHLSLCYKNVNDKYEALTVEHDKLQSELDQLQQDYHDTTNALHMKYQTVSRELEVQKPPPSSPKKTANKKCTDLGCKRLKTKFSSLETDCQSLKLELEMTKAELNEYQEKLEKAEKRQKSEDIAHLKSSPKSDIGASLRASFRETNEFLDLKKRYDELEVDFYKLKLKKSDGNSNNQEIDARVECLEAKIVAIKEEKQEFMSQIESLKTENSGYRLQLALQVSNEERTNKSAKSNQIEVTALQEEVRKLETDNFIMNEDNSKLKEVLARCELEIYSLSEQLRMSNSTPSEMDVERVLHEMVAPRSLSPIGSVFDYSDPSSVISSAEKSVQVSVIPSHSGSFTVSTLDEISSEDSRFLRRRRRALISRRKMIEKRSKPKVDVMAVLKAFQKSNIKFTISNDVQPSSSNYLSRGNNLRRCFPRGITPFVEVKKQEKEKVVKDLGKCSSGCKDLSHMLLQTEEDSNENANLLGFFDVKNEVDSRPGSRGSFSSVKKSVRSRKLKRRKLTIKETVPKENNSQEDSNSSENDETKNCIDEIQENQPDVDNVGNLNPRDDILENSNVSESLEKSVRSRKLKRRKLTIKETVSKENNSQEVRIRKDSNSSENDQTTNCIDEIQENQPEVDNIGNLNPRVDIPEDSNVSEAIKKSMSSKKLTIKEAITKENNPQEVRIRKDSNSSDNDKSIICIDEIQENPPEIDNAGNLNPRDDISEDSNVSEEVKKSPKSKKLKMRILTIKKTVRKENNSQEIRIRKDSNSSENDQTANSIDEVQESQPEVDNAGNLNPRDDIPEDSNVSEELSVPTKQIDEIESESVTVDNMMEVDKAENLNREDIFGELSDSEEESVMPIEEKQVIKKPARRKLTVLNKFRNNLRKITHKSKIPVNYLPAEPVKKRLAHVEVKPLVARSVESETPKKIVETSPSSNSTPGIIKTVDVSIKTSNVDKNEAKKCFKRPVCSVRRSARLLSHSPKKLKLTESPSEVLQTPPKQFVDANNEEDDDKLIIIEEGCQTPERLSDGYDDDDDNDDKGPQSPPPEDSNLIHEQVPKMIPLEKVGIMQMGTINKLLKKLLNYSNEEKALDEIVDHFKDQDPQYIARIVLKRVSIDFVDKPDNKYSFAPMMTETQRVMLGFMSRLDRMFEMDICARFLTLAERKLLTCTVFDEVAPITRVYLAICKLRKEIHRMRRFCCDFFYFGGDFAVPFLFLVLTSWCEVLPKFSETEDVPIARILVQAVYTTDCVKPGYNFLPMRDLLKNYYGYPTERWNRDELFQELFYRYLKNPALRSSDYNLLLFCKTNPDKWVYAKIEEHFIPLVDKISADNFKAAVIILIGNLSHKFNKKSEFLPKIRTWMRGLVTKDTPDVVRRSIYLSLQRLSKKR